MMLLVLMVVCCLPAEAARFCQDTGLNGSRSLEFHQMPNQALTGHQYRNLTGARSKIQCCAACLTDTGCFSVQYSDSDELCQLNGASASRFPSALTTVDGTSYFGTEKPSFIALLQQYSTSQAPSLTDCLHQTFTSASSECQLSGQHLCHPWELSLALDLIGYGVVMAGDTEYWYATPESQVQYNSGDKYLSYRDLGPFIRAEGDHSSSGGSGITDVCSVDSVESHLCTLEELKRAFLRGYRQTLPDQWMAFSEPSRYAKLFPDGCGNYTGSECYGNVVANIPSTNTSDNMYCCLGWVEVVTPGICCSKTVFFTVGFYYSVDRNQMVDDCSQYLVAHLCTLAELKKAYQSGYRQPSSAWLFFAEPGRDAQLFSDGCGTYLNVDGECYEGVVATTPRPSSGKCRAFCCLSLD